MARRYLIVTQHPGNGGGLLSLGLCLDRFIRSWTGEKPLWVYNAHTGRDANCSLFGTPRIQEELNGDRPGLCIGRRYGPIEPLGYRGNLDLWEKVLQPEDVIVAAYGFLPYAWPLARLDKKFVVWAATSYLDERFSGAARWSTAYRLLQWAYRPMLFGMEGFVAEKAAKVIALSPHTAKTLVADHPAIASHLPTISCPVNCSEYLAPATETREKIILFAGRFNDPRKRIELLIEAFSRLRERFPDWRLALLGDRPGPLVEHLLQEKNLAGTVLLPGYLSREEYLGYFRRAAVFAMPSDQEGQGIVALEAMASGLPVVTTDNGGTASLVLPGKTGLIVPRGDANALATALSSLLENPALRKSFGEAGREEALRNYDEPVIRDRFLSVFREVWPGAF